jgi:hypothetical protein
MKKMPQKSGRAEADSLNPFEASSSKKNKTTHMKRATNYFIILLCVVCTLASCNKDEETYTTYPAPSWTPEAANYSGNMTAVVTIPDNLRRYMQSEDQLAAFVDDECRGVGILLDGAFFVTIKGSSSEQSMVSFRYYSARNRYMYTTDAFLAFDIDAVLGSADNPEVLILYHVTD